MKENKKIAQTQFSYSNNLIDQDPKKPINSAEKKNPKKKKK